MSESTTARGEILSGWGSIKECAEQYQVSTKTIRRWITDGRIEAKRFGPRLIRVNVLSMERLGRSLQYRDVGDAA